MAAAELRGAWLRAYLGVWALTAMTGLVVLVAGPGVAAGVRGLLGLLLTSRFAPSIGRALSLWAHNTPIAAWPVLLCPLGAGRSRRSRMVGDLLVLACLVANTVPVGAALAAYGSQLLGWVPQLPVEWAGLAMGAAWWLAARRMSPGRREAI